MSTQKKKENDYIGLYVLGLSLIGLGVTFTMTISPAYLSFIAAGVIFLIIGLQASQKKKEEKQPHPP